MTARTPAPHLSVAVLAYNEHDNLPIALEELLRELATCGVSWELLIIDDGSTDGTGQLADQLAGDRPGVRVLHHPQNLGLGGGYRTGFREARGEWLTFFPADAQFPASIIGTFLRASRDADMVLGYLPAARLVGSRCRWPSAPVQADVRTFRFQASCFSDASCSASFLVSEGRGGGGMELIGASRGPTGGQRADRGAAGAAVTPRSTTCARSWPT